VKPVEAFLSHASQDRRFANRLLELLNQHGISTFYSKRSLRGAQQWHDEIGAALARCDWFLLILSPAAVASRWVKRELLYALESDRYDRRIVPLLYRPCQPDKLSWTLSGLQQIDFRRRFSDGCRELLAVWKLSDPSS
jgi:TIR domain-containing protein